MFYDKNDNEYSEAYLSSSSLSDVYVDENGKYPTLKIKIKHGELKLISDGGLKYEKSDWGYTEYNIDGMKYEESVFYSDKELTNKLEYDD